MVDERDIDSSLIQSATVAIVGYGNQGRAHALNLRDRGIQVRVGTRAGMGRESSTKDGWSVFEIEDAIRGASVVSLLVPDEAMRGVWESSVNGVIEQDAVLLFAHGFALTYGLVDWAGQTALVSPAGPGTAVREEFVRGHGVPALVGADPGNTVPLALSYAWALGCARAGIVMTNFKEETECDLFGEQVVLCGGMPELAVAAFETLVESGYSPEVAYTECIAQVRLLADLMARHGIAGMKERVSDTAEFGSYRAGPAIVNGHVRAEMKRILSDVQSGKFASEWITEAESGKKGLLAKRERESERKVEEVGRQLRSAFKTE